MTEFFIERGIITSIVRTKISTLKQRALVDYRQYFHNISAFVALELRRHLHGGMDCLK